ncbi:hypothetical protein FZ103_00695 [Streptomonospora sp. PA3]|uniref:hypothetical protein n=1 Tax=Streptomonospora sp. PA3 TaxID=2607326 RepID=UPI0012DBD8EF|nr:hypothetical protein [Streptomonospora sp. PA3]MUL39710.1 hypothetical protein [Streptomonospora sp. PA3]
MTTEPPDLAMRARDAVNAAPAGSMQRRAAGCVLAVLATTSSVRAAHKALAEADLDGDVRAAAHEFLAEIDAERSAPTAQAPTSAGARSAASVDLTAPISGEAAP